jgi:uncharacterized DUF497 family protein
VLHIESLEIDDHILDKIESKHNVTFNEVEEACLSDNRHVRKGKEGLYKVFSKTAVGRFILVVLVNMGGGNCKVATARGMTDSEKQLYKKLTGGK